MTFHLFCFFIVVLVGLTDSNAASNAAYCELAAGQYCAPASDLVTQSGTYTTAQTCANQCAASIANYKFFNYVPSSEQCECTTICNIGAAPNPNVNAYGLASQCTSSPSASNVAYCELASGQYCTPTLNLVTQSGIYTTSQACANQCAASNISYEFFNYVSSSKQCECATICDIGADPNPNVNLYGLKSRCISSPSLVPTYAPSVAPIQTPSFRLTIPPTAAPTVVRTTTRSTAPTAFRSITPTARPTAIPSAVPTKGPSIAPTAISTKSPTAVPSIVPTLSPSITPTATPTAIPTVKLTPSLTAKPTVSPSDILTVSAAATSKRIVGYLENWQAVPSKSVLSHYTHVIYAFVETNSSSCILSKPSQSTIDQVHAAGSKILASVGGAIMNNYWQNCTVHTLVKQLTSIVKQYSLDGIDIDYEVDPPKQSFVVSLHNQLRDSLSARKLITHSPENNMMVKNGSYWKILQQCKGVDFISIQYYNDEPAPTTNETQTLNHFHAIVKQLFNGDGKKVVFGFCITACGNYSMNGTKAAAFTQKLVAKYGSSFGGVMNWAINEGDTDGAWSTQVRNVLG